MPSWIQRLIGRKPAPAPSAPSAPSASSALPAPSAPRPSAPLGTAASVASPAAAPTQGTTTAPTPAFGARRPLLDRAGGLAGYEFRLADAMAQRLARRGDVIAQGAHATALFAAMKPTLAAGRIALARFPLAVLARPQITAEVPAGAMLVLDDQPFGQPDAAAALAALRARGALLGAPLAAPGVQFVLIDAHGLDAPALEATARAGRAAAGQPVTLIACDIDSLDLLEHALRHGIDLATGTVDRFTPPRDATPLPPAVQRVSQLLNLVMASADTAAIAAELRNDVRLTYQLLRHANSPLLGVTREVESVEQAVMLLGRDALYRWLSMLLLNGADRRVTSRALQEIALCRARLLELLAPAVGGAPSALFTTGLLSMLDAMLGIPMIEALHPLNLAAPARQALLEHTGPWHAPLALARALEHDDTEGVEALAAGLGGLEAVNAATEAAWAWAGAAAAELRGG